MLRPTRLLLVISVVLLALAALPAGALGASASTLVEGQKHWALYRADVGEENNLLIQVSPSSRLVRFTDQGANIDAGPGCTSRAPNQVDCRIVERVRLVQASLGDREDRADAVTVTKSAAQVNVVGGDADDRLRGHGPTRFGFNGNRGDDVLVGSDGPDLLRGELGNDLLFGRAGADFMIGDAGQDVLRAGLGRDRLFGGDDADRLDARDEPNAQDGVVSCGAGVDRANEDQVDGSRTTGCERIRI